MLSLKCCICAEYGLMMLYCMFQSISLKPGAKGYQLFFPSFLARLNKNCKSAMKQEVWRASFFNLKINIHHKMASVRSHNLHWNWVGLHLLKLWFVVDSGFVLLGGVLTSWASLLRHLEANVPATSIPVKVCSTFVATQQLFELFKLHFSFRVVDYA